MKKRVLPFLLSITMACTAIFVTPSMASSANIPPAEKTVEQRGNLNYFSNQGKLNESEFVQLPMGAVEAKDWLLQQLYLQKNGLTSALHDDYPLYGPDNGWRGGRGDGWEKGAYYLRGLTSLAWALGDQGLQEDAMEWIDFILGSQRDNGFMGPLNDGDGSSNGWDWWPRMVILQVIRDYYEATELEGNPDQRVLPFFEKYFRYQLGRLPSKRLESWAASRGGDNIEVLLWYYDRVFDAGRPEGSDWIIELAELLASQTISQNSGLNWLDVFRNTTVREHVVNTTQAMKTPAVLSQLPGREDDKSALKQGIFNMGIDHGRVDNLANSDEAARENLPYRGAELCSVVESLLSNEISLGITGESWLGDEMERTAYNNLPAGYTPDYTGHNYYQAQNQVMGTHGNHEFDCDHGDDSAYGAPTGFECCFPNMHMGWPKFVQNMWMATKDNGLALVAYGPNTVTAKVADGKVAVFEETTDYPFKDTIHLEYSGEQATFPLKLRIPAWCKSPSIQVNGTAYTADSEDGFVSIERNWSAEDQVTVTFPMEVRTSTWYNNSTAVEYGPLIFALRVEEDWRVASDDSVRQIQYQPVGEFDRREVYPASDWNYALVINEESLQESFQISVADEVALQPFTLSNAPITMKVKGQLIPDWQLKGNVVPEPPYSPIAEDVSLQKDVELVPYGCTRLRITQMPTVGTAPEDGKTVRAAEDANVYLEGTEKTVEFDNVVVPNASDYTLKVSYTGTGKLKVNINEMYEGEMEFTGTSPATLEHLASIVPGKDKHFYFEYGKYNNIRFIGNDNVTITGIEVIPSEVFEGPKILSATAAQDGTSVSLTTNIDRADGFYSVRYGTKSGEYTKTATNFFSKKAMITGLTPGETYYFQVVMTANGRQMASNEAVATFASQEVSFFEDDFADPEASKAKWTVYDPQGSVTFEPGKISIGSSTNLKVMANTGEEEWTDYAVEATLTGPQQTQRDFGIMFRCSDVTDAGADSYKGYYAGIDAIGGGIKVGYANGAWNTIKEVKAFDYEPNKAYHLKVLVCGNLFKIYVDDVLIFEFEDSKFQYGSVGLRSWKQPFEASYFQVRELTDEEEKLFPDKEQPGPGQPPVEVPAEFNDDFEDTEASSAKWRLCGDLSKMQFADGKLHMASSNNVKAVAGDEDWTDYVAEVSIALDGDSTQNAGLMYRVTNVSDNGSDNYFGNYFGIGNNNDGTGYYILGYAQNGWNQTARESLPAFENGKEYRLKAVVYGDMVALYLDGQFLTRFINTRFERGMIGLRSYEKVFSADNVSVRPVTEEDLAAFDGYSRYVEEAFGAHKTIQIKFPRFGSSGEYKIVYGTEPGVYTNEVCCLSQNNSGARSEKLSISVPENDKDYFVRIISINGREEELVSDEIKVHTGDRLDVAEEKEKLSTCLDEVSGIQLAGYTEESASRVSWALGYADRVLKQPASNLIDVRLAKNCLLVGKNELKEAEKPPVDKTALENLYKEYEEVKADGYTEESFKVFQSARNHAKDILDKADATQEEVDNAAKELEAAYKGLKKQEKPPVAQVNKAALQASYQKYVSLKQASYTKESWNVFSAALTNAKKALDAKSITQAEVDQARTALEQAYKGLKKAAPKIKVKHTYTYKGLKYKVTKLSGKSGSVTLVGASDKNRKTLTVPAAVTLNGIKCKVTAVGTKAFQNYKKLTKVTIGSNVVTIGTKAFYNCKKLERVTIGKNVTTIGKQAFYKDKKLKSITIKTKKLKNVGKQAFQGISSKAKISAPKSKKSSYKKLLKNKGLKKTVKIQ